ncbi:MAG: type I-G CRISPR-associated protein, Cas3-extension family [Acidimicrobiales bacterium]
MTAIALPALRSDDSLGFLAALGALELLTTVEGLEVGLGWDGLGGEATLVVDLPDTDAVAERLRSVAVRLQSEDRLVPADKDLILRRWSTTDKQARREAGIEEKNDPMRGPPLVIRDRLQGVATLEAGGDRATARWAAGLVTMLAVDRTGMALMTPLYAPAGQQVLAQLLEKYLAFAVAPGLLDEALFGWRRRPDGGANLDYRDLRDAAWSARGSAENASVPGAIWLALMATPIFRQCGSGRRGEAVGWRRGARAVRPRTFRWPVWEEPRSIEAVEVMLSHPAVCQSPGKPGDLRALGISAVCEATRAALRNGDGPLRAARVVWP